MYSQMFFNDIAYALHHGNTYMGIHNMLNPIELPLLFQPQTKFGHQNVVAFVHVARCFI